MSDIDIFSGVGIRIALKEPSDFLKIKETLTRIGVESHSNKTLYQSCHILHKRGQYAIVHFKELFYLDGKATNISENDTQRRNTIARLLGQWNLVQILESDFEDSASFAPMSQIKIIPFHDKTNWLLQPKYNIGKKRVNH